MKINKIINIIKVEILSSSTNDHAKQRYIRKKANNKKEALIQSRIEHFENEADKYFQAALIISVMHFVVMIIFSKNTTPPQFICVVAIMSVFNLWFFARCLHKKIQAIRLIKTLKK